jgi:hypothetical protein
MFRRILFVTIGIGLLATPAVADPDNATRPIKVSYLSPSEAPHKTNYISKKEKTTVVKNDNHQDQNRNVKLILLGLLALSAQETPFN